MRRFGYGGVLLALALVLGAVVTASASAALPEYKECAKVKQTGAFKEGKCRKVSPTHEGNYEIAPGLGNKTALKVSATKVAFEQEGSEGLQCKDPATITGETAGTKEQRNVVMTLKDCELYGYGCTSAGEPLNTIKTAPLKGVLGYISKSPLEVGIVYTAEAPGGFWVEAQCEPFLFRWKGAALGEVKGDINVFSKGFVEHFVTYNGSPELTNFEGGKQGEFELNSEIKQDNPWENAGQLGLRMEASFSGEELMIAA